MKQSKGIKTCTDFQSTTLNNVNLHCDEEPKTLSLQESLRDETTTNGDWIAIIKLLVTIGVMKCVDYNNQNS